MWEITKTALSGIAAALGYAIGAVFCGAMLGFPAGSIAAVIAGILTVAGAGMYDDLWWPCFIPVWGVLFAAFLVYFALREWRGF